jgi:hypothetical protein
MDTTVHHESEGACFQLLPYRILSNFDGVLRLLAEICLFCAEMPNFILKKHSTYFGFQGSASDPSRKLGQHTAQALTRLISQPTLSMFTCFCQFIPDQKERFDAAAYLHRYSQLS